MKIRSKVRLTGIFLVALSWGLGRYVNPVWLWLSVLVGINVLQSAFTGFCPFTTFFQAIGGKKA